MRVITRMNIGGPAVHVNLLTRGLAEQGFETTLVSGACSDEDGEASPDARVDRTIHIRQMSKKLAPLKDAVALAKLVRLMRAERPDIVHTHLSKAGALGRVAAVLTRVPVVVHTFHGNTLSEYFSPLANRIFRGLERFLARASDCLCVVSEQQRKDLTNRFRIGSERSVQVVPLGLDLARYNAVPPPVPETRPLTIGWVGRLVPVKNVPLLADIVRTCHARNMNLRFVIAGGGPDKVHIDRLTAEIPAQRVRYLGWQSDIPALLRDCDVLLQTSKNEGTPLALIEGMAAGRPFVSTAVGGITDMVCGAGEMSGSALWHKNGVLCEPSAASIADVLYELQADPQRVSRMGEAARAFASARYASERLINDVAQLYRRLLASHKPPVIPLNEYGRTA